jgi:hypothetical protein
MSEAAFQRETLLALQDATFHVAALVREELERRYVQERSGEPQGLLAPPEPAGWSDALDSLSKLEARVAVTPALCFLVPGRPSRPSPPGPFGSLDGRTDSHHRGLDGQGELLAGQAGGGVPRHPLDGRAIERCDGAISRPRRKPTSSPLI